MRQDILNSKQRLTQAIPEVATYTGMFKSLNRRWSSAITAGMIEAGQMKTDAARLFKPLIEDMRHTKELYGSTQAHLMDAILVEMTRKIVSELIDAAKFTINILKRNLFERTADVGYLATDSEIVHFLRQSASGNDDTDPEERRELIRHRLAEYQYEYTVYDEILILDTRGQVLANLDPLNRIQSSNDPLLAKTQAVEDHEEDQYIETFSETDLRPGKGKALMYSQKIKDPDSGKSLGTLCLCFDFEDEASRIFTDLNQGNPGIVVGILDERGKVITSNTPSLLPLGTSLPVDAEAYFRILSLNEKACLVSTVPTDGYQGFYGLTWYGVAMIPIQTAFKTEEKGSGTDIKNQHGLANFSKDLSTIRKDSHNLLGAMKIDSINGEVQAAKFRANAFVKVLHFVKEIGENIDALFSAAIENIQQTIASSLFTDVEFRAFQGNNIADRNLYERANDVCWWALTPLFRSLMAKHLDSGLDPEDLGALTENLQYINDLYTPYLRLALVDTKGAVVAVSEPPDGLKEERVSRDFPTGQAFVGMMVETGLVDTAMRLQSSKDYSVSDFEPTPLYGGRPTYIYSTAVREIGNRDRVVGTIQIVFDSAPQFLAMLTDVLPRDETNTIVAGCFGVFADRKKKVISSTSTAYPPGSELGIEDDLFRLPRGARTSRILEIDAGLFAVGLQVSDGYREYKNTDGYENDILCMIFVPI